MTHNFSVTNQTRLLEKVSRREGELTISYSKYILTNGLILLVHKDNSDPLVHVDVTYHVGSAREAIGMSGFAHFFEHMMFEGSRHVGNQEHFRIITESGGTLNGTTNKDRTNYFQTVPSNQLETVLWLESDRMGFLLEAVNQHKFEIQRETVKNEKGENYDNRPYGMVPELVAKNLYPSGHPYSWTTIGDMEDLDSVSVEDLKKFFLRWYGPNNAILSIGGNVNEEDAVKLMEKYFGSIPPGPDVERMPPNYFQLKSDRYVSYEDNVRLPMLQMVFPTVPAFHKDEAPLDLLSDILGGGKNSLLYKNMVKNMQAVQAYSLHPAYELAGELRIGVLGFHDRNLADMESLVRDTLMEFEERGVIPDDLARSKATHEAGMIFGLESVKGKVSQLALYQFMYGNSNYVQEDLERYMNVTADDIIRVYKKYVSKKNSLVVSVYPKGKRNLIAAEDNYETPAKPSVGSKMPEPYEIREVIEDFDRGTKPAPTAPSVPNIPDYYQFTMGNGLRITGAENHELPVVAIQLKVACGHWRSPKGKEGIVYLLASLMQESTLSYTPEEIANEVEKLGSRINVRAEREYVTIDIKAMKKNLDKVMALAGEIALKPAFREEDFNRVKTRQIEYIENQKTKAEDMAAKAFNKLLYGDEHPYSTLVIGSAETVQDISLEDVEHYYRQYFIPNLAVLLVCGNLKLKELLEAAPWLQSWESKEVQKLKLPATPEYEGPDIYMVHKEEAPHSQIRVGYLALPFDATGDFYKATIMNYPLGDAFNSRINLNLREDKGYTYGAGSYFFGTKQPGAFTVYTSVRKDFTKGAVTEIIKELKDYHENGISERELEFTKSSMLQRQALRYETNAQKLNFLFRIAEFGLDKTYLDQQADILQHIQKHEVDELAKKYLPLHKMAIIIVGDLVALKGDMESLGYGEIIELKI